MLLVAVLRALSLWAPSMLRPLSGATGVGTKGVASGLSLAVCWWQRGRDGSGGGLQEEQLVENWALKQSRWLDPRVPSNAMTDKKMFCVRAVFVLSILRALCVSMPAH